MGLGNFILKRPSVNFLLHYPARKYMFQPLRSTRILCNAARLLPLLSEICPLADKIILFGSRGKGINRRDSDFDLFIVSSKPRAVSAIINRHAQSFFRPIDSTVYTPTKEASIASTERPFLTKLRQGVVLWQAPAPLYKTRAVTTRPRPTKIIKTTSRRFSK